MGVRTHLDGAVGELISARRTAELKVYSREVIYNMEVLIRALSRVKDQIREENHVKQKEREEAEAKAFEKARRLRKAHARAKRKSAKKKRKQAPKRRTRKIAA